jgi:hypothetical protein
MDPREAYQTRSEWWGWHVSPCAKATGMIQLNDHADTVSTYPIPSPLGVVVRWVSACLIPGWLTVLWRRKPRFDALHGQVANSTQLLGSVCFRLWLVDRDAWGVADRLLPRCSGKTSWVKLNLRFAASAADLVRPLVLYCGSFCGCKQPP